MIVLQADKLANMPVLTREHVGESMLPSMRQYLRFIDLENEYDIRGFIHKVAYAAWIKRYYQLKLSSQAPFSNSSMEHQNAVSVRWPAFDRSLTRFNL